MTLERNISINIFEEKLKYIDIDAITIVIMAHNSYLYIDILCGNTPFDTHTKI